MEDVETLNRMAFEGKLDVTKLSYHAFAYLTDKYQLLTSGSALGFNCGPLLIGMPATVAKVKQDPSLLNSIRIAIPGKFTTANFLLSLAYPAAKNKMEMVFSGIESAVLSGEVDLGLIIHENRFTYRQKGLEKVIDLGEWWEAHTKNAIPLGGIVVDRRISQEKKLLINDLVKQSVEYAFAHPGDVMSFVKAHAQEMDEKVMKQHIDLYVNKYSIDLGNTGRKAVLDLFEKAEKEEIIATMPKDIFVK